jgi:hypothetical protein
MPPEPEAAGLLALMLLARSRREARVGPSGEFVTLEHRAEIRVVGQGWRFDPHIRGQIATLDRVRDR